LFLKSIILRGFKSFAKKSLLEFEKGINVIVGPNGSGKSNITDAISWVLGEQSAKSLRGTSMEDVIFKSKNEELSIADVSIIFDNKDKFLPLEFNEVKITRRVFQKGGSEYFINSTPSRLMDILDLTSERGIGRGLYTIVNQGQIDEITLIKPLERKIIIDEILGIAKHKQRRLLSKNKLAKVTSDIERISDLMLEVKRTMDPLEIESKKARKYFEILNILKNEEMSLFISELNDLNLAWELENERAIKLDTDIEKIKLKILEAENERTLYEKNFTEKKQVFESLKSKIENYNNFKNRFESNESLVESKKNIFATLVNVLNTQYAGIKNSLNQISDLPVMEINDIDAAAIKQKMAVLKDKIGIFYKDISSAVGDRKIPESIESQFHNIIDEIDAIEEYLEKNLNSRKIETGSISRTDYRKSSAGIEDLRNKIGARLEHIKKIQKYCIEKINQSENFLNVMLNLNNRIEQISADIYSGFDEIITEINSYNSKTSDFIKKINDLGLQRQGLENEHYKTGFQKEQIKEKVKILTEEVTETYNLPVEFIFKNFNASENKDKSKKTVRLLKNELKDYGSVNPNATTEYQILKERFNFLETQKEDLSESRKKLDFLILEISKKIDDAFNSKFEEINTYFKMYFKLLFPLGKGELTLQDLEIDGEKDFGIELRVDIGNSKTVPISLLSGGEKALVSIAFLFAVFSTNYSPFYVFDEIDASLDDMNLNRFVSLVKKFSDGRQIIIITHQKKTMEIADAIYGVTMQSSGFSKVVSEKVNRAYAEIN